MKSLSLILCLLLTLPVLTSCGGFKAKRVSSDEGDAAAMEITDKWVSRDTEQVVGELMKKMKTHKGFKRYLRKHRGAPILLLGDIQNKTSEAYFPIDDINDELLTALSESGDFQLVDAAARESILKEVTYQHDGMVDPQTAQKVGKQTGAELMIMGNILMKPYSRKGKTIKQYRVNIRMTSIESGLEVLRVRKKLEKFSQKGGMGW